MKLVSRRKVAATVGAGLLFAGVACSAAAPVLDRVESAVPGVSSGQRAVAPSSPPSASVTSDGAARSSTVPAGAPAVAPASAQAKPADATAESGAGSATAEWDRMVIRNARLTLQVQDVERALAQVRDLAKAGGGYVSASNTHVDRVGDKDQMVADLTLQVRSDALDTTIAGLRQLAVKVESENTDSQDVTDEYVDLDSNLRNLQASEQAILKLMDRAQRIEDVLSLQRELTNVRGQIERIQGRKNFLQRKTDMATVAVSLRLPPSPDTVVTGTKGWDPLAEAQRGWQASLNVLRGVASVAIVVAAFSWWLLPILALGAFLWRSRRHSAPHPATPAA